MLEHNQPNPRLKETTRQDERVISDLCPADGVKIIYKGWIKGKVDSWQSLLKTMTPLVY